jgi:SAM-dependent methyltransferase
MTQADIRSYYETEWKATSNRAASVADLAYSNPVEDAVLYPTYVQLLRDLGRTPDGKSVLDVGSGSGRWIGFFTKHFAPSRLLGMDYTAAAVELLRRWWADDAPKGATRLDFRHASITDPTLDLGERFDLINIANVLFHIPEHDHYIAALANLRRHLAPGGAIVTTEYLPRTSMRTNWMLVRSRYDFEKLAGDAGLRIVDIRAFSIFSNDPMGLDGPDTHARQHFNAVRAGQQHLLKCTTDTASRRFLVDLFAEIERATLVFARERLADVDFPSQKLVVLAAS